MNQSLEDSLINFTPQQGLLTEAAIDYYENMRMAKIINHTWYDPNSINMDLDYIMKNFEASTRAILLHLDLAVPNEIIEEIVQSLNFFDLSSSPLYKLSMSNPFVNHVNTQRYFLKYYYSKKLFNLTLYEIFYANM